MRLRSCLPVCLVLLSSVGCGQQYTDPILDEPRSAGCPPSRVLQLDGATYGSALRLIQDDFSIEAWIRSKSSPQGAGFGDGSALVFADVETVQVDDFAAGLLNDELVMSIGGPDTAAQSTSDVATDEWVHVAATRARANGIVLLYVNGVLEGSAVGNDHTLAQAPSISVGGRAGRNFFVGLMSELRLWSVVRSQAEIVDDMQRRLGGAEAGLVGYYRLDEQRGSIASDSSPSANDLAFTGTAAWTESVVPLCGP